MAADTARIRRNVEKMISLDAPEQDIDAYLEEEGFTPESFRAAVTEKAPERSTGVKVARAADLASQGFIDRAAEIVTAPADLIWKGADALGLPTPGVSAADTLKGYIHSGTNAANNAVAPLLPDMGPNRPENDTERFAHGAGGGAADALGMVIPGAALAKTSRLGPLAQNVGRTVAQQPVTQVAAGAAGGGTTEATDNPWLGLAAALAVPGAPAAARRVVTPVRNQLNAEQQRLVKVAQAEGVPLSAAQATGSRPLQTLESVFGTLPMTAGGQNARRQAQGAAFTRAALERAGVSGDSANPAVLADAQQRLGAEFQRLSAATTVRYDQDFANDLGKVITRYANRLDAQRKPLFENFVNDIAGFGAQMPGEIYQTVRSDLGQMAKNYRQTNATYAQALKGLQSALDAAADRSVPKAMKGEWREARRQYSALKTVEKAMANTTLAAGSGTLPPTAFANAVKQQHGPGYARGQGELNDLSRVGTQFVRDPIPNSGTPERTAMINLLGGAGAAYTFDPVTAATGMVVPWALQKAYQSPLAQAYLRNQALTNVGPQMTPGLLGSVGIANAPADDERQGLLRR